MSSGPTARRSKREIALVSDVVSGAVAYRPAALGRRNAEHPRHRRPCLRHAGPAPTASSSKPVYEHAIELDPRYVTPSPGGKPEGARRQPRQSWRAGRQSAGAGGDRPVAADAGRRGGRDAAAQPPAFSNLNFDLIYGLPLQTIASLRKTCEIVASSVAGPHRLLRLRPYAAPQGQPAAHRREHAARCRGANRSGRGHRRGIPAPWLSEDRHRSFCKARRRAGPRRDVRDGFIAISRAIPTMQERPSSVLAHLRFPGSGTDTSRIFPTFRAMFARFRPAASRRRAAAGWMRPKGSAPAPLKA